MGATQKMGTDPTSSEGTELVRSEQPPSLSKWIFGAGGSRSRGNPEGQRSFGGGEREPCLIVPCVLTLTSLGHRCAVMVKPDGYSAPIASCEAMAGIHGPRTPH